MATRRETNSGQPAPSKVEAASTVRTPPSPTEATPLPPTTALPGAQPTRPLDPGRRGAHFPADRIFQAPAPPPDSVLRRLLFKATGGHLNPGPSHAEAARQRLIARVRTPIANGRRCIASVSLKGGVGKTTTTVMLGHTLAAYRGDNVIAIDANPDAGNLAGRIHRQTALTARDLLRAETPLERYADLRPFTSQSDSRLQVLAGDADAMLDEAFSAYDYHCVLTALERFYSLILTDCGTGILHDAMRAVLWYADQLVVVTTPSVDSAKALNQLLGWLDQHDQHALTSGAILVVNGLRRDSRMSVQEFESYFGPRCRGVTAIPYDPVLATGGECELADLDPKTQRAYLELAAQVADGFVNESANGR